MNKNYVFNLNKLLYMCCARPNGRTVRHINAKLGYTETFFVLDFVT